MLGFVLRRLSVVALTLLVSTFGVYVLVAAAGDPRAPLYADRSPGRAARIAARTQAMRLDVPLPERYLGWLGRASGCALPGRACDLGRNAEGQPVLSLLGPALAATGRLVLLAGVLSVLVGVAVGVLAALRRGGVFDRATTSAAVLLLSLPAAWVAVLAKEYVAIGVNDWLVAHPAVAAATVQRLAPGYAARVRGRLLPTVGSSTPGFTGDAWERFVDAAAHLVLPTTAMVLVSFAGYSRLVRTSLLEVLSADHLRLARAKGLSERAVVLRHGLRTALIPVATLAAIDAGALVGGAVVTENVFGRPGMGTLLVTGLALPDPDVVMACYLVTAAGVAAATVLADVLYALLDPRIRR